ncbi:MAG: branched-chain amino acid aminotransferase [Clostridia bacterium]|nr:branched-chain amino acid aminotransferase [Clostridia bacterium]
MMKADVDWGNLGFGYVKTDERYVSEYKDGKWDEGRLTSDSEIVMSECACVLQYAQTCFEGLKAYTTEDGRIVCFRPDMNAQRMIDTCERLKMPTFSVERFVDAVVQVVRANAKWVPPYGTGASLYLRPFMFGKNPVIGVKPANDFEFRIFATPVGPYFKGGVKPLKLRISDLDRAAPHGTGHVKAGLNYAMSLYNIVDAHEQGYDENLYLDSATHTYVEETGGANIIFITKEGKVVTPKSSTILPSITRRSLLEVATKYLGLETEEREIRVDELKDFAECGLCGTAAVISPVGCIVNHGEEINFPSGMTEMGPITKKLYDTLRGIQMGTIEAPEGWIQEIC